MNQTELKHADGSEVSTSEAMLVEPSAMSPARRAFNTVVRSREMSIFLVLVVITVVATAKNESFLFSSDGWRNFLLNPSILVLLAVGQAVVIITRNVDLSVGSVMALTAYLTGRLFIDQPGLPIVAVFARLHPVRRRARPGQRRAGGLLQGPVARHHARARSTSTAASC